MTGALLISTIQAGIAIASPVRRTSPTVQLDNAIFTGVSSSQVSKFLGIPFARPPTGDLRFRLPQTIGPYNASDGKSVTSFGDACPQQSIKLPILSGLVGDAVDYITNSIYNDIFPSSEDCLTLNVVTPATATPGSKLPVAIWIFGGGFETGSPSIYDGTVIVDRSIALGDPVVYVSINYRRPRSQRCTGRQPWSAGSA